MLPRKDRGVMFVGKIPRMPDLPCLPRNHRETSPCSLSWEGNFTSSVTENPPMMVLDRLRPHEMSWAFARSFHSTSLYMWWLR